jgi:hypothetical protein
MEGNDEWGKINPEILDNPEFMGDIKPDIKNTIKEIACSTPGSFTAKFWDVWNGNYEVNDGDENDDRERDDPRT